MKTNPQIPRIKWIKHKKSFSQHLLVAVLSNWLKGLRRHIALEVIQFKATPSQLVKFGCLFGENDIISASLEKCTWWTTIFRVEFYSWDLHAVVQDRFEELCIWNDIYSDKPVVVWRKSGRFFLSRIKNPAWVDRFTRNLESWKLSQYPRNWTPQMLPPYLSASNRMVLKIQLNFKEEEDMSTVWLGSHFCWIYSKM